MTTPNDRSKVWFITGCSTGFGRALAKQVLERGYRCVVTARDVAKIRDLADAYPKTSRALALDVSDPAQRDRAVTEGEGAFGSIDVLVNNAGYGYYAAAEEGEEPEVRAMFETNFYGLIGMMQRVLPGMRARGHGHIVNLSSVGGLVGQSLVRLLLRDEVRCRGIDRIDGEGSRAARDSRHVHRARAVPNRFPGAIGDESGASRSTLTL